MRRRVMGTFAGTFDPAASSSGIWSHKQGRSAQQEPSERPPAAVSPSLLVAATAKIAAVITAEIIVLVVVGVLVAFVIGHLLLLKLIVAGPVEQAGSAALAGIIARRRSAADVVDAGLAREVAAAGAAGSAALPRRTAL